MNQYQAAMNRQQSGRNDWDGVYMQNAQSNGFNAMHAMTALGRTDFEDAA